MTRPVRLIIEMEKASSCLYQDIHGEITGAGQTESGDGYIVFKDEESERKIPLRRIKTLTTDVNRQDTT
jgi:hypothetical protein